MRDDLRVARWNARGGQRRGGVIRRRTQYDAEKYKVVAFAAQHTDCFSSSREALQKISDAVSRWIQMWGDKGNLSLIQGSSKEPSRAQSGSRGIGTASPIRAPAEKRPSVGDAELPPPSASQRKLLRAQMRPMPEAGMRVETIVKRSEARPYSTRLVVRLSLVRVT